jgi:hypothetical protein
MASLKNTEICYLLAFPDPITEAAGPQEKIRGLKDAPYFEPVDIRVRMLGQAQVEAGGASVSVTRQRYEEHIQILECHFQLPDGLSLAGIQQREIIEKALTARFVPAPYQESGLFEEYVILLVRQVKSAPDAFLDKNAVALARFIRSQREVFDQEQLQQILTSRVRYSRVDLTLVDWEGAVIIAPEGDFQADIELLKVGNYQLLRYRLLDQTLNDSLNEINEQFRASPRRLRAGPTRGQIRRIIQHRLDIMLDFEHSEQNLLLIGDWYTAQLYHAIHDEFYLAEWKEAIKRKLDALEAIIGTIRENFSLTWQSLVDNIQLIGWFLLLIGYIYLYFFDAGWIIP